MKYKITIVIAVITCLLLYLTLPIYQFYAHKYKAPMVVPWGYLSIPNNAPHQSAIYDQDYTPIAEKAQSLLHKHRETINAPGLSIAIAMNHSLIWTAGFGWADINSNTPMTPDTLVRIGSNSKALTATGLARMVQSEMISLDAPLDSILAELPNPQWAEITPRRLASHSAGIPHYKENSDLYGLYKSITLNGHFENVYDAVGLFDDSALLFPPGEQFHYSSLGTVLLSAAMQSATDVTYQQWIQQQVLTPLAMSATLPEQKNMKRQKLATFYWQDRSKQRKVREWRYVNLSHRLAGGGWLSTSEDLAKLGQGFINNEYIMPSVRKEFWTPQMLNNGKPNEQNYGIGWRIHTLSLSDGEEISYAHHGGVSRGAQSFLVVVPKYKLSLAININSNTKEFSEFGSVVGDIIRLFIGKRKEQINAV
ncbi:serine hydrolase domain-containing protein [Alteromonas gracilis]|uniref:serine hydrolase domain-containing protein n=1 Tax=Alteromonas gracilis TaxID=1479524 RepID=UPI00373636BA